MSLTQHADLNQWVNEMAQLCQPDRIVLVDGTERQRQELLDAAVQGGELIKLNESAMPGCYYHRTASNDVARTEHLTYICTPLKEDAGPTNNWMAPAEGYRRAGAYFQGAMKGRTMYVVPFSMGPVGSPFSKIGVELTDSIYVVLNLLIMVRAGKDVLEELGLGGEFTKCLHSKADLNVEHRLILHFPEDNTIWSVGSGYGGNVLLNKKCLGLRIASHMARKENWLAEHMLIVGIEEPNGRIDYVGAAFPSACGKTNLAMLIPPEGLKAKGYRIWTVGDDIAWMRIDTDRKLWGVNPETGFFGVAPGTNSRTNPSALKTVQRNTIFTNVVLNPDNTVWWEDGEGEPHAGALNWQGRPWQPGATGEDGKPIKGAHPNSRYTAPIEQCPSHTFRMDHHHGVPISAIIFGGRRAHLAPLVYQSFDWAHGVYVGATMASELTAAQYGKLGEIRRDPMAMLPFCGYNMADYFEHWLRMGVRMRWQPKIFHVNWFRQDENGAYLWPGFGENLRVLEWILARCRNDVSAHKTAIGFIPQFYDLDMTGLDLPAENIRKLFEIDPAAWMQEVDSIEKFLKQFGSRLPISLWAEHEALKRRLEELGSGSTKDPKPFNPTRS